VTLPTPRTLAAASLALTACLHPTTATTATDTSTTATTTTTTDPDPCGDSIVDPPEVCDHGTDCADGVCNLDDYTGPRHCAADCSAFYPNWCGDKVTQPDAETCDLGGDAPDCDADCTLVECGDGHLNTQAGEVCDLGDANSPNDAYDPAPPSSVPCNSTCQGKVPHCGDALCQPGPEDNTCSDCSCGDGIPTLDETCDDGTAGSAICDPDCTPASCGDGTTNPMAGELCDDGNQNNDDACRNDCTRCGDVVLQPGETCDDGNVEYMVEIGTCGSNLII